MKAVVQTEYGTPDVMRLEDVATPSIGADEVLVRVHAASVNPPDWAGLHRLLGDLGPSGADPSGLSGFCSRAAGQASIVLMSA